MSKEVELFKQKSGRVLIKIGGQVLGYLEDGKFAHGMASPLLSAAQLRDIANKMEEENK